MFTLHCASIISLIFPQLSFSPSPYLIYRREGYLDIDGEKYTKFKYFQRLVESDGKIH